MKVLFLDIDGVLNRTDTFEKNRALGFDNGEVWMAFEPELLQRLKDVHRATNCHIVLSSDWRCEKLSHTLVKAVLAMWDMSLLGCTPDFSLSKRGWANSGAVRGEEIEQWIDEWNLNHEQPIDTFAIVDDVNQFHSHQQSRLVETDAKLGMTPKDMFSLVRLLNEPSSAE